MNGRGGGIENNTDRNLKDLEETLTSFKTLKRNNEESRGIFVGPSMAPRFFSANEVPSRWVFHPLPKVGTRLRAQILRHGWQADDAERGLAPFLRSEEKYSTRRKSVLVTNTSPVTWFWGPISPGCAKHRSRVRSWGVMIVLQ